MTACFRRYLGLTLLFSLTDKRHTSNILGQFNEIYLFCRGSDVINTGGNWTRKEEGKINPTGSYAEKMKEENDIGSICIPSDKKNLILLGFEHITEENVTKY